MPMKKINHSARTGPLLFQGGVVPAAPCDPFRAFVYNIGLLAAPWFEVELAQCLADILAAVRLLPKWRCWCWLIAVTLLVQAARFIKRFYVRRFANINRRMKGILYANLVRQSRPLEKEGAGELMTKAIADVDDCVEGMRKFTTEVFDTGVALAVMRSCCWCTTGGWRSWACFLLRCPMSARQG